MSEHEHKYAKLSDEAVFCEGCGDIKTAEPATCTLPHWQPSWVYYPPIYPTITQPWVSPFTWGTTTYTGVGSVETLTSGTD